MQIQIYVSAKHIGGDKPEVTLVVLSTPDSKGPGDIGSICISVANQGKVIVDRSELIDALQRFGPFYA